MYATVMETQFKPGTQDEAIAITNDLVNEMAERVQGLKSFVVLDRGGDRSTVIAVYDTKENWEAAAPVAQEILGKLGGLLSAMPERSGCEVPIAINF